MKKFKPIILIVSLVVIVIIAGCLIFSSKEEKQEQKKQSTVDKVNNYITSTEEHKSDNATIPYDGGFIYSEDIKPDEFIVMNTDKLIEAKQDYLLYDIMLVMTDINKRMTDCIPNQIIVTPVEYPDGIEYTITGEKQITILVRPLAHSYKIGE